MATSVLATSAALLALEVSHINKFRKPLIRHIKNAAYEVTAVALKSVPLISAVFRNYEFICGILSEVQHHSIQYECETDSIFKGAKKEIGDFFKSSDSESMEIRFPQIIQDEWDVHHSGFKKLSFDQIQNLLEKIYEHTEDPELYQAQVAQVLSKRLVSGCWNEMKEGFGLKIPVLDQEGNKKLVSYVLDKKFDLWQDIPAFGFIDIDGNESPLVIFRCTNPDTDHADAWPSLLANLHPKGPAWKLYDHSHNRIEIWLEKKVKEGSKKARLMGYSQGAALASYFLTYKAHWISTHKHEASYLFDGPGISNLVYKDWKKLSCPPQVYNYIHRGDLVPKLGEGFIGHVFQTSVPRRLSAIEAHRSLTLLSPRFKCQKVHLEKELKSKVRRAFSVLQKSAGQIFYPLLRKFVVPKIQSVFYGLNFSS